jgi:hypothetical protein
MIRNTKKGRTPFKSKRHGKTRRVQRGGVRIPIPIPINDEHGNQIGTYDGNTGEGRAVYPEPIGGVYVGEFENGVPHGQGTMTYNDGGGVYTGQWENDLFHGKGKLIYQNGDVYEGEWAGNNMNGHGIMTYKDNKDMSVYDGYWKDDERNGPGIMTYKDMSVYDGYWKDDERNGPGAMTYANGGVYVGNWENDNKNGTGTYTFANGDVYEGKWDANFMHGLGKMTYANGDVYEGKWDANFMHGLGKMTYANKDVYEGEFAHDKRQGTGKMTYANRDVYEGEFAHDKRQGTGKMTYANKDVYEGQWFNDHMVVYNVIIARTPEEFMSICSTAVKPRVECMKSECQICNESFIDDKGHLLRPVMFHKTVITNADGKRELWSCPVHPEEQLKYKHNNRISFSHTECINCRANLFLTEEQTDEVLKPHAAATKLQKVIRGRRTRKKVRQAKNLAAFNAEFPPRSMSRPRSNRNNSEP